jgi:acyl-CoA reductase-like NAD-dependent aldehyde dehydrogenase
VTSGALNQGAIAGRRPKNYYELVPDTSCEERDKIILSFALAMNERNNAWIELETATEESERLEALNLIASAAIHSQRFREQVLNHCREHGC